MKKPLAAIIFVFVLVFVTTFKASALPAAVCGASAVTIKMDQQERNRVQSLILTGYKGNYTLTWAEEHDYKEADKVKWVNLKGYSSETRYLIWVSIAYQRLNVFTGSKGCWSLDRTFIIGTGVPGRDTPVGVWKILDKCPGGWTTHDYAVRPVVRFINEKYGFHSRLYHPESSKIVDSRIGFPCSHGCIRMYTSDVKWFYDTIPLDTAVIVY